nr:MAG TPA: hypothetical protein [Caudoviricetes sp.]
MRLQNLTNKNVMLRDRMSCYVTGATLIFF